MCVRLWRIDRVVVRSSVRTEENVRSVISIYKSLGVCLWAVRIQACSRTIQHKLPLTIPPDKKRKYFLPYPTLTRPAAACYP